MMMMANMRKKSLLPKVNYNLHYDIHTILSVYYLCLPPVHQNYVGTDAEKNPFYLSVVLSDQNNQRVPQYRAILWRKTVSSTPSHLTAVVEEVKNCYKWLLVVLLSVLATWLPLAGVRVPVRPRKLKSQCYEKADYNT